jgi:YggT family protein
MGWTIYGMLIQFLFWIPLTILFFRIALPLVRAPFSDPLVGWVYSVSNPLLRPLERFIPRWRNLSLAAVAVFWLVASIEFALLLRLSTPVWTWLIGGLVGAVSFALGFLIALIVLHVLFSLFQPRAGTSLVFITERIARPICNVFRRRLPLIGPFDLSPAFAMLLLMLLRLTMQWATYELSVVR